MPSANIGLGGLGYPLEISTIFCLCVSRVLMTSITHVRSFIVDHIVLIDLYARYVSKLDELERTLKASPFFLRHEVVGSSLLLLHDRRGNVGVWAIDFGKTVSLLCCALFLFFFFVVVVIIIIIILSRNYHFSLHTIARWGKDLIA